VETARKEGTTAKKVRKRTISFQQFSRGREKKGQTHGVLQQVRHPPFETSVEGNELNKGKVVEEKGEWKALSPTESWPS